MKVELRSYTPDALNLLLETKNTRLDYNDDPAHWSEAAKAEHLAYMLDTIKSSWEFVDYVFRISGVSRAFTHQLVRTRTGKYAQESQRTVNVADHEVLKPELDPEAESYWDSGIDHSMWAYAKMIEVGVPPQDARGVLPTNVTTSILAKFDLRCLHEMAKVRLCTRAQGEYQEVFRAMRDEVLKVHPWAEPFIRVACAATGVCAFPRYKECPIKPGIFDPKSGGVFAEDGSVRPIGLALPSTKDEIQERWRNTRHEARPKANKGRTM